MSWGYVILAALAVAIWGSYRAGMLAGEGRAEQEHGDQAEELARALGTVRRLEQRCERQAAHLRAVTDWERINDDAAVPGLLRAVPMPRTPPAANVGRKHRPAHSRPYGLAGSVAVADVEAVAPVGQPVQDELVDATSWDEWPVIMAQIASGREWVAAL